MIALPDGVSGWERAMAANEAVKDRLRRAAAALESHAVPYAVVGGNAVAEWVGTVDEAGVRTTRDVDIMLHRSDFEAAKAALESAGFSFRHAKSIDMFLDGRSKSARDAIHIFYAGESVRADAVARTPDMARATPSREGWAVIDLVGLVTMKLTSYRDKDRMHLRDLLDVELIDASWPAKFPPPLAERLQHILDTPDG